MSSKESSSLRSCSASFTACKISKNSIVSSFSNSFSRRSSRASESLSPINRDCKDVLNKRSCSATNTRETVFQKGKPQVVIANPCFCLDCATPDNIPKHHLQNLEDRLVNLKQELCKEKNQNNFLRRRVMIAKKIVKREVGGNSDSFDCLLQKAKDEDWMGRQEMICFLKRKLRDLNEVVERLEENTPYLRRPSRSRREQSPVSDIPDERQVFWCLELERRDVMKNADRDRQRWIADRDVLDIRLQEAANRNDELIDELHSLREQIATTPKIIDEGVSGRLRKLGNELRTHIVEKVEDRRKLDDVTLQICRNTKSTVELRAKITFEKQIVKDKEAILESLRSDEIDLRGLADETRKENTKGSIIMKKKLGEMEQDYTLILIRVDKIITQMSHSKVAVGTLRKSQANCRVSNIVSSIKSDLFGDADEKKKLVLYVKSQPTIGSGSRKSLDGPRKSGEGPRKSVERLQRSLCSYESKLQKYKSILVMLEQSNLEKSDQIDAVIIKTNEMVISYLIDRYVLWKRTFDTDVLKSRIKKLRKATNPSSKLKMVKKKDSVPQLIEALEVRKQYLSILKAEGKYFKILIKSIFNSTHDDIDLVKVFPCLCKERFLVEFCKKFNK